MSFKRDGDDKDLFGIAMRHRVAELLSEDIPEDDVFLMRNGKLSCTVCQHRPVFDTINMLAIHRKGKRHLESEEHRQRDRDEVFMLATKRAQLYHLQSADKMKTQLGGQWKKAKPYDRKRRLDIASDSPTATTETTPSFCLPGFLPVSSSAGFRSQGKRCHTQQQQAGGQLSPFAQHPDVDSRDRTASQEQAPAQATAQDRQQTAGTSATRAGNQLAVKYLQARGAGWKKDLLGNWVKDDDAEFDSDDEPPDLP